MPSESHPAQAWHPADGRFGRRQWQHLGKPVFLNWGGRLSGLRGGSIGPSGDARPAGLVLGELKEEKYKSALSRGRAFQAEALNVPPVSSGGDATRPLAATPEQTEARTDRGPQRGADQKDRGRQAPSAEDVTRPAKSLSEFMSQGPPPSTAMVSADTPTGAMIANIASSATFYIGTPFWYRARHAPRPDNKAQIHRPGWSG